MICLSIGERTAEDCLRALQGIEFAEIRIDMLDAPAEEDVRRIFAGHPRLIATCRPGSLGAAEREALLTAAIDAGAAMVDIEVESPDDYKSRLVAHARGKGCRVIVSYHNHDKTPSAEELRQTAGWCFSSGADIAKIACMANSRRDSARLLGLLDDERRLAVVGMGAHGRIVRIVAPMLGSAFTFAASGPGKETAPGQMDRRALEKAMEALGAEEEAHD
jgi:3-dehydroquinate dehydratase-1